MKQILTIAILIPFLLTAVLAQKRHGDSGDRWTGEVVSTNESTREIVIQFHAKGGSERFSGILAEGYKARMNNGTYRELRMSDIPIGMKVELFVATTSEVVGGQRVSFNRISRIEFLGRDEYAWLRATLGLDQSFPVRLEDSTKFALARPLKIYLHIEDKKIKNSFIGWTIKWNREQAVKFGAIDIVSTAKAADVLIVVRRGTTLPVGGLTAADAFLIRQKSNEVAVLWKDHVFVRPDDGGGPIEKAVEKRLKAKP
ncbi:MAG TPA: hypothetical protein VJV03_09590 [Pyrinomonadaceae bacterium]|nr:hypothetical protein [Pyrinomonadaceae bacterium]